MDIKKKQKHFGGLVNYCTHESSSTKTEMNFAVFLPPNKGAKKLKTLYWLSGLTCSEENFITKANFGRLAAELEMIIVAPDTSPRGDKVPDDADSYDFGKGAGFYVDATREPWSKNYQMYSYISQELPELVEKNFPVDTDRVGIFGHSMGGHGALVIGMRNSQRFKSISAFAPIVAPMQCPWGEKALSRYLGDDRSDWAQYDACEILKSQGYKGEILVHQGLDDNFLKEQLKPELLEGAAAGVEGAVLQLHKEEGYDHSYFFIASFMEDHLNFHSKRLG